MGYSGSEGLVELRSQVEEEVLGKLDRLFNMVGETLQRIKWDWTNQDIFMESAINAMMYMALVHHSIAVGLDTMSEEEQQQYRAVLRGSSYFIELIKALITDFIVDDDGSMKPEFYRRYNEIIMDNMRKLSSIMGDGQ